MQQFSISKQYCNNQKLARTNNSLPVDPAASSKITVTWLFHSALSRPDKVAESISDALLKPLKKSAVSELICPRLVVVKLQNQSFKSALFEMIGSKIFGCFAK